MRAIILPVTPFQQNCSIVWNEQNRRAAVVDPGGDLDRVLAQLDKEGLTLEKILLTHAHLDHAAGTAELAKLKGSDFPGGDQATLLRSIRERLFPLGDDVTFVPGHGPTSTFGNERRTNPFVADRLFAK